MGPRGQRRDRQQPEGLQGGGQPAWEVNQGERGMASEKGRAVSGGPRKEETTGASAKPCPESHSLQAIMIVNWGCCRLDRKYPPKAGVLSVWSLDGGPV